MARAPRSELQSLAMKRICLFALLMSAAGVTGQSASAPVTITRVEPHSHALCALAHSDDQWGSCLIVSYKNVSSKPISAIRFEVSFVDALGDIVPSDSSYVDDRKLKPGKSQTVMWGDGYYWHQIGDRMQANVSIQKIAFADGTVWPAAASSHTSSPSPVPAGSPDMVQAFASGLEMRYPTIKVSVVAAEASFRADNADRALCQIIHMQRTALHLFGLERARAVGPDGQLCEFNLVSGDSIVP